ncbi:MAG: amidohydrolase [Acidobacteria bacterium]|nr:MAG: amidohydrolase [Acidobacteriota bacterium]
MRALALSAAVLQASTPLTAVAEPVVVFIKDARIVTVSGPVIEKGSVVIAGGKIAAVGAGLGVPAGATVIEGTGKTVYPGLIDGLTTIGLVEIQSVPGSVDTTEVGDLNPQAKAWVALNPHSEQLPVARANGITAALVAPLGGLVSGQSALIRLAGSTPDALTMKTPVALHVVYPSGRPTADPARAEEPEVKTFEEREKDKKRSQERALGRLRNLLEEAKAYGAALDAAREARIDAPKPDLGLEALVPFARGAAPVVVRADGEEEIRGAVRFADERGLKLIVAGGLEAWRCTALLKEKGVAVLLKVDRLPDRESDPYDAAYANPERLRAAGVRFAIVSDDADTSRNLPYEAAMAHAYGLPASEAVRAITLSPAEIFGVADSLGSIDPGKAATLVVATGDVLDHRTEVTHVFIDGVAQPLETRHTRLFREFKDRP